MAGRRDSDQFNPVRRSVSESDYEKKFNRTLTRETDENSAEDSRKLKEQESAPDTDWKTAPKSASLRTRGSGDKKGAFRFAGRRAGKLRSGSAFAFVITLVAIGVLYSSVFAPNILLVNVKDMYTNDLTDATIALNTYYWKMMNYKIGRSNCSEKDSIKCKLSTMPRAQKKAFEKQGFTVVGSKVEEDNRDDSQPGNEKPESRYQVSAIIPPAQSPGIIATGDMLYGYAQLSDANKALVYSVFHPKASFFMDTRYKQTIKSRYNMTKSVSVGGNTEQAVDKSFDNSVKNGGGISTYGTPDLENGISLGSLSSPATAAQLLTAMMTLTNAPGNVNSFVGLQCAWYSYGKAVTNNAKSAKAATVARFAMQYLKQADAIKAGTAEEIPTNVLSSKLAQSMSGGYNGPNATDSSMYKSIVYGELPIPSIFGLLYYLDTFDLIGAMIPAWSQIMASAAAQGQASQVPGSLTMPPANLTGADRDYCLEGEKQANHDQIKNTETQCIPLVESSATPGFQGALTHAVEIARETCPPEHDHYIHSEERQHRIHGEFVLQPALKATAETLSPIVAELFGVNAIAWANAMQLLFTSQTKGVAASDALFAGTGQILGDMAMSRGMMPSNAAFMAEYMLVKDDVEEDFNDVARYEARKNPFDPYNKFSFLGSLVRGLTPAYSDEAPLFSTIANALSLVGDGIKHLNPSAGAIYYLQPDPFNPARLTCPDPEYLAILIMADTACNVRYSFSRLELIAQVDTVLDYMTQKHEDAYQDKITELEERRDLADPIDGDLENVTRMLETTRAASTQPFIDDKTGKAIPNSEYDKFLQYCVNRQDPWGRSGIHVYYQSLTDEEIKKRRTDKSDAVGEAISPQDSGYPYQKIPVLGVPSLTEGAKADQDWYSGKKCTEQSEMLTNFRAYTMICSVDGSLSGSLDCSEPDFSSGASYADGFYLNNDILYTGW